MARLFQPHSRPAAESCEALLLDPAARLPVPRGRNELGDPLPVGSAVPSRSGQPARILPLAERSARGRDADKELRDEIQRIALEFNCYGRRRIRKELRRRDWKVNHKRVRRRNRHGLNDSHVFPCVTFSSRLATSRD
jgi:HTH-like domain